VYLGEEAESTIDMEEIKAYYDEKSRSYDDGFRMLCFKVLDAITWKYLEPCVPTQSDALVLDAGGGTGRWAIQMARRGCKVILMDASDGMLEVAVDRIDNEGFQQRISVKKGDVLKSGFPDETFDLIFSEQTLFLFDEPDVFLGEMKRILKREARLIVSAQNLYAQCLAGVSEDPSVENLDNQLKILRREKYNYMTKEGKVKIQTWTPDEFRKMLERNGFRIEKIIGKGITFPLRISEKVFRKTSYSEALFEKILELELAMCEKPDALALAGHLQAIAVKM
jgi:ubiquinone/menaquinone biosynthesis C-methylase UbiE